MFNQIMKGKEKSLNIEDLAFQANVEKAKNKIREEGEKLVTYLKGTEMTVSECIAVMSYVSKKIEGDALSQKV